MAVYPTKTNMLNKKNRKLKTGIVLTSVFSLIFLLLVFNLIEIFNIFMLGTFGLILYPLCIFFITLGILLMCNKSIATSKSIVTFCILWLCIFVLILQMATSKDIDLGFGQYMATTFKKHLTAGGVLFGVILYPIYALTYDVATYIILAIILVIFTAILIDKIYVEMKNKKLLNVINTNTVDDYVDNAVAEEDTEEELAVESTPQVFNDEENIFIADEEEKEQQQKARSILGLSSDNVFDNNDEEESYTQKLERPMNNDYSFNQPENKKPNIFVHEEELSDVKPTISLVDKKKAQDDEKKRIDEERRSAALNYLNISRGKFETKNQKPGIDNVSPVTPKTEINTSNLNTQKEENLNRLSNLTNKFNFNQNNQSESNNQSKSDLFDENFTKKDFSSMFEKLSNNRDTGTHSISKVAQQVYSGDVKENLVDAAGYRPVQVSMIEPATKNKPSNKPYKKPPTVYNRPPIDLLKKYSSNIEQDSEDIQIKGQKILIASIIILILSFGFMIIPIVF